MASVFKPVEEDVIPNDTTPDELEKIKEQLANIL